jgi:uncharacterized phage protein (TIGR02220 family)
MKYTVMGFSQEKLIELGLDMKDAMILRYFIDFKDTKKMRCEVIDGETYHWVKYEGIAEEYPILKLSNEDSVYRRLKKLVKASILKHKTIKNKGTYSYYALGESYLELITSNDIERIDKNSDPDVKNNSIKLSDKIPTAIGHKSVGGTEIYPSTVGYKSVPNNPSTNNPSTINNPHKDKIEKSVVDKINELCGKVIEYLNSKAGTRYKPTTTNTAKSIKTRVNEGFVLEDFYKVIDNKFLDWHGTEMEKFLRPETLFGNKFEGYLNQNISGVKGKVVPFKTENNSISNARMYKSLD